MNNEIKSQDDLGTQGRESDVLIATIMKCQELVKEKVEIENDIKELKQKIHILTESQMKLENTIGEFGQENVRLKELLKECQEIIEWYKADCGYKDLPTESVLTKIEEALK